MNFLKTLNIGIGIALIIVLVLVGMYLQKLFQQDTSNTIILKTDSRCNLGTQGCRANLGNKSVSIRFIQPVKYLKKLELEVIVSGFNDEAITKMLVDFSMLNMNMGINRFMLTPSSKENHWKGMIILPVCVTGRKDWRATLYLQADAQQYAASYGLIIEN